MLKYPSMIFLILGYILTTPVLSIGTGGKARATRNGVRFCRWVLRVLGVSVTVRGVPQAEILVANHLSYIDIVSLLGLFPCRFITFTEMGRTPGVGLLASLGQTLFINRSQPSLIKRDLAVFENELRAGLPIVFFPEGTSYDGEYLRPFKSSLFESAIRTGVSVQPVCLRYTELNGEPVSFKNRDRIYYYGEMELLPQLLGLLKNKSISLEIVFGAPISSAGRSRKEIAGLAHAEISQHFLPVVP